MDSSKLALDIVRVKYIKSSSIDKIPQTFS